VAVGLALACFVGAMHHWGWTKGWEFAGNDLFCRLRPPRQDSGQVVVIGITDECIRALGPTPWPRATYGEALDELKQLGASVVCFDIFFPPRGERSGKPGESARDDEALAAAMRRSQNVVLPVFDEKRGSGTNLIRLRSNAPSLTQAAAAIGHINIVVDVDGVARRAPILIGSLSQRYLELGAAAAAEHLGLHAARPERRGATVRLDRLRVPCDEHGDLLINWRRTSEWVQGRNLFRFSDLYRHRLTPEQVRGKVVLIGQVASGLPNADLVVTPFGTRFGLLGQADIAESVVTGRFSHAPEWRLRGVLLLLVSALIGGWLFGVWRLGPMLASTAGFLAAAVLATYAAFGWWDLILDIVPTALVIALTATASVTFSLVHARAQVAQRESALDMLASAGPETAGLSAPVSGGTADETRLLEGMGSFAASLQIPEEAPPAVLRALCAALGAEQGLMRLSSEEGGHRWLSADPNRLAATQPLAEALAALAPDDGRGLAIPEVRRVPSLRPFAGATRSALVVPLCLHNRLLAIVVLCGKRPTAISPAREFEGGDLRIASAFAAQGALLLEQARLHRGLHAVLRRAVGTVTAAVDAKDRYTHGHSERVTFFAVFLARELGLSALAVEAVQLGAILHDVGKIGLEEPVLKADRELDERDWALIEQHPVTGAVIFGRMEELSFLLPALRHHHERWDGSGYPDGLRGTEIPLLARIVAVADAFDAMTFPRPYRQIPLSFEQAAQELRKCAGIQFDPDLARLFVDRVTPELLVEARTCGEQMDVVEPALASGP
jgi:HD-GYP domain-containing protein (c-di-GMP phosphodiesterase class II)/CHASE2 domain-containing sensor protein